MMCAFVAIRRGIRVSGFRAGLLHPRSILSPLRGLVIADHSFILGTRPSLFECFDPGIPLIALAGMGSLQLVMYDVLERPPSLFNCLIRGSPPLCVGDHFVSPGFIILWCGVSFASTAFMAKFLGVG